MPKAYAAFARTKVAIATSDQMASELLKDPRPTILHFRKSDCASCDSLTPTIEKLSDQHEHIQFATVDVDHCKNLAQEYNIKGTPAVAAFLSGKHVHTVVDVNHDSLHDVIQQLHGQMENVQSVTQTITRTLYPDANNENGGTVVETEEITITGDGAKLPERGLANQPAQDFMDHEMAHHNKQGAKQQRGGQRTTTKKSQPKREQTA